MTDQLQGRDSDRPVAVGIAGLGRAGWGIHARVLAEMADRYAIVAVSDPDAARQQEAEAKFGCRRYGDTADLMADESVELLVMATPSPFHCADSIAALRAGKHVLTEKPMALSLDEADRMIDAAEENGRILSVNQNYRFTADFLKIQEVVASGVLGQLIQIRFAVQSFRRRWDWQTLKEYGGGILNNQGAHMIDLALQFIDDPSPTIFADLQTTALYAGDAESHAKILIQPESGPLIDIELTHANAYPQAALLIMGTQGTLIKEEGLMRWRYFDPSEVAPLVLDRKPTPDRTYNSEDLPMHEVVYPFERDFHGGVQRLYQGLYQAIRHGGSLPVTPESVRRQIAILARCKEMSPV